MRFSFGGVVYKYWQIIFETFFFCKFVFNFECMHTSKFPCIEIMDKELYPNFANYLANFLH